MNDSAFYIVALLLLFTFLGGFGVGACSKDTQWRKDLVDNPTYINAVTAEEKARQDSIKAKRK